MIRALHIFIILAIALAGASPACKFISGQEQQAEAAPCAHHSPQDGQEQAETEDQCAFCFNTAKIKITTATPVEMLPTAPAAYRTFIATADSLDEQRRHYNFRQRGPPAFL